MQRQAQLLANHRNTHCTDFIFGPYSNLRRRLREIEELRKLVSAAEQRIESSQFIEIRSEAGEADMSDFELGNSIWLGG
jgi:hypothetical protein